MSLINLRERLSARMREEESGFSLVELLVVMLILGLLAAIAIPAFFNQQDKAQDADAKSAARTAQTAIETYATDNGGSYVDADAAALTSIEETLNDASGLAVGAPGDIAADPTAESYQVSVDSSTGNTFSIARAGDGTTDLTCTTAGEGGCPDDGSGNGVWGS